MMHCLYLNSRSIIGKFDLLESWTADINPDVIAVTESWTNNSILDSELSLSGYTLFRKDRPVNREGGGVLLYVRSSLKPTEFKPGSRFPEQAWCRMLDSLGEELYLGVCYRTPTDNIFGSGNHEELRDLLCEIGGSKKHFMLIGDFNYSFRNWPLGSDTDAPTVEAQQFVECLDDNFLTQHVTFPTRKNAILDLIITDEPDMIQEVSDLGAFGSSDHIALEWNLLVRSESVRNAREIFDYSKADVAGIRQKLQAIDWQQKFGTSTVEACWSTFKSKIHELESQYVPVKVIPSDKSKSKPIWMSHRALKAVKRRHRVYRKYKDSAHPACKKANKAASCAVRDSRINFEKMLALKIKDDKKSFYAYVRSKTKSKAQIGPLRSAQDEEIVDPGDMAECFNEQFLSVFTAEDMTNIPVPEQLYKGSDNDKLVDIEISVEDVKSRLAALREDKSPGPDNFSPRLLKKISEEIAVPVTVLFNRSMKEGDVPMDWKTANITPIFKKGSRNCPGNYRPVSLTSLLSKLMESIVRDEIVKHLDIHNLIRDSQHGFRRGRSCTSNLLEFLDKVTEQINEKGNVDVIFLDFAKAFDKVPHMRLLTKLRAHGIDGCVAKWIASWLQGRMQRVCLDGRSSQWAFVLSGIPQGSVLGPLLFLIFVNDLDSNLRNLLYKFADDTKVFGKVNNAADGVRLQEDLNRLCDWANMWQMEFNVAKCVTMHIGNGNIGFQYSMQGRLLDTVTTARDLGVHISSDLKSADHCYKSYSKANRMLGLIKRTVKYKTQDLMVRLYKSLVRPHLEYCAPVWSPHYKKDKILLEKVQHRFTRLFDGLKNLEYSKRLRKLNLWTLEERRNRADLIELFKMVHGISAVPLNSFFQLADGSRTRGHSWKLMKGHSSCDARLYFFSVRVINRWNNLPQQAVEVRTVNSFKAHLDKIRRNQMDFFMDV